MIMNDLDKNIEEAKRMRLGEEMRTAVRKRITYAVESEEEYTSDQFDYWVECLNSAAGWVGDEDLSAAIYRDIGMLISDKGTLKSLPVYYEGLLDSESDTIYREGSDERADESDK